MFDEKHGACSIFLYFCTSGLRYNVYQKSKNQTGNFIGASLFPKQQWHFLHIRHTKPTTFSRSYGDISFYLNDVLRFDGEVCYPQVSDPLMNCVVGGLIDPEFGVLRSCFKGQMVHFFIFI